MKQVSVELNTEQILQIIGRPYHGDEVLLQLALRELSNKITQINKKDHRLSFLPI